MAQAMVMPKKYFFDRNGRPLAFGKVYTYQAGTNINQETFKGEAGDIANTNPIILNGEGYADIYLNGSYRIVVNDKNDNEIWSEDPVSSIQLSDWVDCATATYLSPDSFKVDGNVLNTYEKNRRVRVNLGDSTFEYATIESATYSGQETTIKLKEPIVTVDLVGVCRYLIIEKQTYKSVSINDVASGLYVVGDSVFINERSGALFEVVAGGLANGIDILDAGNGNTAVYKPKNSIKPRELGAVSGEVSTNQISKAIDLSNTTGLPVSAWWDDEYIIDADIVKTGLNKVTIEGNATFKGQAAGIYLSGTLTELTTIAAQSVLRDNTLTLASATGIAEGDTLIVWNSVESSYSVHRTNYYDGEFVKVKTVSGNVITTESALQSAYAPVATNKVYKLGGAEININGCNFTGGSLYSLQVKYGEGCRIDPLSVINKTPNAVGAAASAALNLNKCYKVDVNKGRYFRHGGVGGESGTDYGIGIANCQNVSVDLVDAYARRHPVSTGGDANDGAVPCRFIKITKSKLTNDPAADIYAADFHGNTQDSYYEDCEIYGSIGLAGKNIYCKGGSVHAWGNQRAPLVYHELVGGDLSFIDVRTTTDPDNTAIAVLNNASSTLTANIEEPYRITLRGGTYQLTSSTETIVNLFENSGQPNAWYVEDFGAVGDLSNYSSIVDMNIVGAGIAPSRLTILNPRYAVNVDYVTSNVSLSSTKQLLPAASFVDNGWDVVRLSDGSVTLSTNFSVASTAINTEFLGSFRTGLLTATLPKALVASPTSVDITPDNGSAVGATISTAGTISVNFFLTAGSSQPAATRDAKITVKGKYF